MASLQPKTNKLGKRLAAHLLRRTTFYITPARITQFADMTPAQALAELMTLPAYQEPRGPTSTGGVFWLDDGSSNSDPHSYRKSAVHLWYHNEVLWRHKFHCQWIFARFNVTWYKPRPFPVLYLNTDTETDFVGWTDTDNDGFCTPQLDSKIARQLSIVLHVDTVLHSYTNL